MRQLSGVAFEILALASFPGLTLGFLFFLVKDAALAPPWPFIQPEVLPWFLLSLGLPLLPVALIVVLATVPRRRDRHWPELAEYGGRFDR
jgi:hypothetical protein